MPTLADMHTHRRTRTQGTHRLMNVRAHTRHAHTDPRPHRAAARPYTRTHANTHTHTRAHTTLSYTHTRTRARARTHARAHTHTRTHARKHTHARTARTRTQQIKQAKTASQIQSRRPKTVRQVFRAGLNISIVVAFLMPRRGSDARQR